VSTDRWFLILNGQESGPYSREQLDEWGRAGRLGGALVRAESGGGWVPAFAPAAIAIAVPVGGAAPCYRCGATVRHIDRVTSHTGWIVFWILLVLCFLLCWLGLLMKEDRILCGSCGAKLR
jgi:hypothetical protein